MDAQSLLRRLGFSASYSAAGSKHIFKKDDFQVSLQEYNPIFLAGPYVFRFLRFPVDREGRLKLPEADAKYLSNTVLKVERLVKSEKSVGQVTNKIQAREPQVLLAPAALPEKYLRPTNSGRIDAIFLDPGHGGVDPGAVAFNFFEKDLALKASVSVRSALTNRQPSIPVLLLRERDQFMSLEDRCRIANARLRGGQNGLFVSIHLNTWFDPAARGFEVYYLSHQSSSENARIVALAENRVFQLEHSNLKALDPFERIFGRLEVIQYQKESRMIAENVSFAVFSQLKDYAVNRGVKSERFYVLKGALMPSILIEVGFVSSKEDLIYLNDDEKLGKMADAIAGGIEQYIRDFNQSKGFTEEIF